MVLFRCCPLNRNRQSSFGNWAGSLRSGIEVLDGAGVLRPGDFASPGDPVQTGRHGNKTECRQTPHLARCLAQGNFLYAALPRKRISFPVAQKPHLPHLPNSETTLNKIQFFLSALAFDFPGPGPAVREGRVHGQVERI